MKNKMKIVARISLLLLIAQLALVLCSWILNVAVPSMQVRTLLGSEGVRWFFSNFTSNMLTPLLIWIIIGSMSLGVLNDSRLYNDLKAVKEKQLPYRSRHALILTFVVLIVLITIISLLSFTPHAILLGVTGNLFPGPFGKGIIPVIIFSVILLSVVYGTASGHINSITQIYESLCIGIGYVLPLFPLYILTLLFYNSILFVFF